MFIKAELYQVENRKNEVYHYSDCHMLVMVVNGRKNIKYSEEIIDVMAGEMIFVSKGTYIMNQIIDEMNGQYTSMILYLDDDILKEFFNLYSGLCSSNNTIKRTKRCFKLNSTDFSRREFKSLFEYTQCNMNQEILKLKLYEILLDLIDKDETLSGFLKYQIVKERFELINFMEMYYDAPISIQELAQISGRSITTFKKHFKQVFSTTPKSWIYQKRLEKSAELLFQTDHSVTEICFLVGFDDVSHFIKLFKNKYFQSPGQYRKTLRAS
jgi:AraC-like DNA-binding protein